MNAYLWRGLRELLDRWVAMKGASDGSRGVEVQQ